MSVCACLFVLFLKGIHYTLNHLTKGSVKKQDNIIFIKNLVNIIFDKEKNVRIPYIFARKRNPYWKYNNVGTARPIWSFLFWPKSR